MQTMRTQVAVIGGGPAGVCAAIAAARHGIQTMLVTDRPVLGGNSSSEIRVWTRGATGAGNLWAEEMGVWGELKLENLYRNSDANPVFWDETLLDAVLRDALETGKTLALPRCEGEGVMRAYRVARPSDLRRGAYGIWEPDETCPPIEPDDMDLILVPGTAFDRQGDRLGQGGGYYDRYLAQTRAVRIGVCHDFALLDAVPTQTHDARMDGVVTPKHTIVTREETT